MRLNLEIWIHGRADDDQIALVKLSVENALALHKSNIRGVFGSTGVVHGWAWDPCDCGCHLLAGNGTALIRVDGKLEPCCDCNYEWAKDETFEQISGGTPSPRSTSRPHSRSLGG